MGNAWKGIDDEKFLIAERKVLAFSGIPYEDFKIDNVIIDDEGNWIRTIQVGDPNK